MWSVVPRDGSFVFRNFASGQLLCQSGVGSQVDCTSSANIDSPFCQWRIIDAYSGEPCPVLYDSMLSAVPPELSGEPPVSLLERGPTQSLTVRAEAAPPLLQHQLSEHLQHQHQVVRDMLRSGYTSLVVVPQLIRGWKDGRVHDMTIRDEGTVLQTWKPKGKGNFDRCEPR